MFKHNNWAIVNLTPISISFSDKNVFLKAKLPSTIFSKFELSQEVDLVKIIEKLLKDIKIKNNRLVIVISNEFSFNKSFSQSTEIINLAQQYLDNIPLENILFSLVQDSKNYQLSVVDQQLVEKIKSIFKKYNFNIKAVIPESLLKVKNIDDQQKLKFTKKNKLTKILSSLCLNNFSASFPKFITDPQKGPSIMDKIKNKFKKVTKFIPKDFKNIFKKINKLWLLISSVLIIIIILSIIIFPKFKKTSTPKIIVVPTVIPTPTEYIPNPSKVIFQISYTRYATTKILNQLKADLNVLNYTNLKLTRDPKMKYLNQTYLIFSATNSARFKNPIIKTINNIFKEVVVQESADVKVDTVNIKLGRNK